MLRRREQRCRPFDEYRVEWADCFRGRRRGGHDVLVGLFQIDHMTSRAVMLGATLAMMLAILVGTGLFILAFRAMSWATFYVWPGDRHQ
jgi:hypothetical protein